MGLLHCQANEPGQVKMEMEMKGEEGKMCHYIVVAMI
jgi:hypothetical protein